MAIVGTMLAIYTFRRAKQTTPPDRKMHPMPAIYAHVSPVALNSWAAEMSAFIATLIEDSEAARLENDFACDDDCDAE